MSPERAFVTANEKSELPAFMFASSERQYGDCVTLEGTRWQSIRHEQKFHEALKSSSSEFQY